MYSENKRISNDKSDSKNMKSFPLKLKKDLMIEFEKNIDRDKAYSSRTQFLKEKIEEYNNSLKVKI